MESQEEAAEHTIENERLWDIHQDLADVRTSDTATAILGPLVHSRYIDNRQVTHNHFDLRRTIQNHYPPTLNPPSIDLSRVPPVAILAIVGVQFSLRRSLMTSNRFSLPEVESGDAPDKAPGCGKFATALCIALSFAAALPFILIWTVGQVLIAPAPLPVMPLASGGFCFWDPHTNSFRTEKILNVKQVQSGYIIQRRASIKVRIVGRGAQLEVISITDVVYKSIQENPSMDDKGEEPG